MPRGRPKGSKNKTRVTKKALQAVRAERKKTSYQRKKRVIPGPWTETEVEFEVKAKLRKNKSSILREDLGVCYGVYRKDPDWNEKGWYPIIINIEVPRLKKLVEDHGIDNVMAACEKSLSAVEDKKGKPKYGTVVLLSLGSDNSQKPEASQRFLSVHAKTNKKGIEGFRAIRKGEMVILGKEKRDAK